MFDEAGAFGKIFADASVQPPLRTVVGGVGAKDVDVLDALELIAVHRDHDFPVMARRGLHANRDRLPRVRLPLELSRDDEAFRIPWPETEGGGVGAGEDGKDDQRRPVVAVRCFELKDVTELSGPVEVRIAPPGRAVLERVAGLLVRPQALYFRALAAGVVSVAVAIPPLVRLVAQRHSH